MQTTPDRSTAFSAAAAYLNSRPRKDLIPAKWMPVYVEPITYSGERITVAVAITTTREDDAPRVINTLDLESLKAVFAKFGEHLFALADNVTTDLQAWLATGGDLDKWEPSIAGVYPGRITSTKNVSIDAIIQSAKTHTSLFSAKHHDSGSGDQVERSLSKFQQEIRKLVLTTRDRFGDRFNRPLNLYGNKGRAVISYVGTRLAMNFSALDPAGNASYQCATAQRKINQLLRLRDVEIGHDSDRLLLGIWIPRNKFTPLQEDLLDSYTSELEYAALKADVEFEVAYGGGNLTEVAMPFARRILADD